MIYLDDVIRDVHSELEEEYEIKEDIEREMVSFAIKLTIEYLAKQGMLNEEIL